MRRRRSSVPAKSLFNAVFGAAMILLFAVLAARAETLPLKKYTTADGLAHDTVIRIVRDSRGFLWFCTSEGLSRFDGYRFKNYTRDQGLPHLTVLDLIETRDGQYWLATSGGLVLFNPQGVSRPWTGTETEEEARDEARMFRIFRAEDQEPGKWNRGIHRITEDSQGNIWGIGGSRFYVLRRAAGDFVLRRIKKAPWGDAKHEFWAIAADSVDAIWVSVMGGIYRLLPDGNVQKVIDNLGFVSLYKDKKGFIWAGRGAGGEVGLLQFTYDGLEPPKLLRAYDEKDGLMSRFWQYGILETSDGKLWVASVNGLSESIARLDDGTVKFRTISRMVIGSLGEDAGGNLWIGTESSGAFRLSRSGFKSFEEKDGLKTLRELSMATGADGEFYFVSALKTIYRFDGDKITAVSPLEMIGGSWGWNQYHFQDSAGEWWIAGSGGLQRYPKTSRLEELARTKPKKIYTTKDGLPANEIFRLFEDSRGDIWIGTLGNPAESLARWERATDKIHIYTAKDGVPERVGPTAFAEDRSGNIWVGYYSGGLARLRDGRFQVFGEADGLPAGFIRDLHTDGAGRIWIAAANGVARIDAPADEAIKFSPVEGLSSGQGNCLTEDNFGRIYIGTGRGLNRLDANTGRIRVFTTADGLAENLVKVCEKDKSGALWLGFYSGLSRYVPEPETQSPPPPIFISDVVVNGSAFKKLSELGETSIENLELNDDQRQIQIEFFALGFAAGENLRYQYKLDDADWVELSGQRTVNFELMPGSHNFEVRAVNSEGVASERPARVSFSIAHPVWRRWWFLLIAAFVVSVIVYAIYRYRVNQIIKLERVRTRLATDLHDDIGSSLSKIAILSEVVRKKNGAVADGGSFEPLEIIANTSREMVDSMSDIVWAINPERDHLSDLVQRMRHFTEEILDAQEIEYEFSDAENLKDIALGTDVRREVYLIFKECVNNLAKHSGATRARFEIRLEKDFLVIEIEDDGRGFAVENLRAETSSAYAADIGDAAGARSFGGNGLRNMRRRAENLGGEFEIDSEPGNGTRIALKVPID